jgi:pyruvate/2-oxoglutarate dehydrogenase complex dihydrolipoamide dehydrogenase (E3) component
MSACSPVRPRRLARRSRRPWRPTGSNYAWGTSRRWPSGTATPTSFASTTAELRGEKLLVATGRRPRLDGIGLENVGIEAADGAVAVDERLRAADGVWAIGDATGIMPFTHVGKYQARIAAGDIFGANVRADYRAVPRVVFTDPQVAAVGERDGAAEGTVQLSGVARTSTYTREYAERPEFLTLVSDGERLTGAYAVGPEAGEWLQQATLAIRAEVPLEVLRDTIQPFPTFSEAFVSALAELATRLEERAAPTLVGSRPGH